MSKYIQDNLGKDENVIYEASISWATLTLPGIIAVVLAPFTLGLSFIIVIPRVIRNLTTELAFTNKRLIGKTGLISTKSMDSPLNKVQNVIISSGLLGKIFNFGDVAVTTAAGNYIYSGVSNPSDFRAKLMNQIEQYDDDRIKKQAEELANAIKK